MSMCRQGNALRGRIDIHAANFARVARKASSRSDPDARLMASIAEQKANRDEARLLLNRHLGECEECQP